MAEPRMQSRKWRMALGIGVGRAILYFDQAGHWFQNQPASRQLRGTRHHEQRKTLAPGDPQLVLEQPGEISIREQLRDRRDRRSGL
jgi:hypothetical protein